MQSGRFERCAAWFSSWRGWVVVLGCLLVASGLVVILGGGEWRDAVGIREAKGRNPRAVDLGLTGVWWAAVINCVLFAGLLATVRWWSRPTVGSGDEKTSQRLSKGFWVVLAVAVFAGLFLRLPRMDLSLYNDEAYTLRRQVSGEFKMRGDGFEFRGVRWSETVWENEIANNHVLFSVLARMSYQTWKSVAGGADGEVNEFWYRFPSLVAGLLGIAAAVWLGLAVSGSARVAGLVAWLVAFHPWHVRYSTEARGYGLLLFLVPVMLAAFLYAVRTGKWKWWILFGATQFLAASTFIGVLYFSIVLNGAAGCWLLWRWWRGKKRGGADAETEREGGSQHAGGDDFFPDRLLARLAVANVLSAAFFLIVMLPHIPQIREALSQAVAHQGAGIDWRWWPDVITYLGLGMPWFDLAPVSEINPSVLRLLGEPDGRTILGAVFGGAILLGLGIRNVWRTGAPGRCVVVALALMPALYFLVTVFGGNALYRWHLIFLASPVTVLIAYGVSRGNGGIPFQLTSGGVLRIVLAMMLFGGYSIPLDRYVRNPKENPRALVKQARGDVYPGYLGNEKDVIYAAFNCVGVYDPFVAITPTVELIREQMAKAEAEGKELYVQFARPPAPAVRALLEDSGEFELVGREPGLEESQYTNYLFRYRKTAQSDGSDEGEREITSTT